MSTSDRPDLRPATALNQLNCKTCGQQCEDMSALNKHCYAMHDIPIPSNYGTRRSTGARPTGAFGANTCAGCGKQCGNSQILELHQLQAHPDMQSLNHNQNYGQVFDQKLNKQKQFTSRTHNYPIRSNTPQRTTNTRRPTGAKQPALYNQVKREVKHELIDISDDNEGLGCSGGVFRRPQAVPSAIQLRFKCNICNKQMDDSQLLALHEMQAHNNYTRDIPESIRNAKITYDCHECGQSFTKQYNLNKHKRKLHISFNSSYKKFNRLDYELKASRWLLEDKASTCNVCGQIFNTKGKLNKHIRSKHNNYQGSAEPSPIQYQYHQYQLDQHMKMNNYLNR